VVRIIQLSIEHGTAATLNAAAGVSLTFRGIADTINHALGGSITIESVPRSVPVIHRSIHVTALRAAFPEFEPTSFGVAIGETIFALRNSSQSFMSSQLSAS
jgi:hypothetical protein